MGKYSKVLIPAFYVGIVIIMGMSVILVLSGISRYLNDKVNYKYTLDGVFESNTLPVVSNKNTSIIKPYIASNVKIGKYFYDFEADENKQEESIVYYENTYLQNNGVDYVSDESFDVVSILDGEIISIDESDVYGKVITIKHNDNLKTVYANVEDVLVSVGYKVSQGEIIAVSAKSTTNTTEKSLLHFEVYYKENVMDPENFYTLSVDELR